MNSPFETTASKLLPPSEALALLNQDLTTDTEAGETNGQESAPDQQTRSFFGINFDDFGILFDDEVDKELIDFENLRSIPNGPSWLLGFTNIRGSITPVFELQIVFSNQQSTKPVTPNEGHYLLVIGKGQNGFAIPVHDLPRKLNFSSLDRHNDTNLAPDILKPFIVECYRDRIPWFAFHHQKFLQELRNRP